jgi:hypothetical protein
MITTMTSTNRRRLLLAVLVVLLGFHLFHAAFQGGGGWWVAHGGILGAIWQFFVLSAQDPVLSAGLSDFVVVATLFGVWMYTDLAPEDRLRPRTFLWLLSYVVFPGLGALLYLLWLRPDHRVVRGPDRVSERA